MNATKALRSTGAGWRYDLKFIELPTVVSGLARERGSVGEVDVFIIPVMRLRVGHIMSTM